MTKHQQAHGGHLGDVYGAKGVGEIAALYDKWAKNYEADMSKAGYRHPSICLALLSRHLPKGTEPLLDVGAGTGLLGEWLGIMGYNEVEALDVSEGMLEVARAKGCYAKLHKLTLGEVLPFKDQHFGGITASGVFTTGHVGPEGLDELIRICRKGGVVVFSVKGTLWDNGFKARVGDLVLDGKVSIAEITKPFVSMPGEPATTPSRGVVLRVI